MNIQRTVKFVLHKRKSNDTSGLIVRLRITLKGERPFDISTDVKVDECNWDKCMHRVIGGPGASSANERIIEFEGFVNEAFTRYEVIEKRKPTKKELKELILDMSGIKQMYPDLQGMNVVKTYDRYISTYGKANAWSESTYEKNNTVKMHLNNFCKGRLTFDELTTEVLEQFISYLQKIDLRNTTIAKDYQIFKWFLNWCKRKGFYTLDAHEIFKPRMKGTDGKQSEIIYLTLDELNQLKDYEVPKAKNYLQYVKDVFLFCCYTSLRYSDVKNLKKHDIKNNCIHIVTQKTADKIVIELNSNAQEILNRYKDFHPINALPVISIQKYNEYLKELCFQAGIDTPTHIVYYKGNTRHDEVYPKYQLITSHCARRTFVVTAIQLGIPVEVIMRWTGHSRYESLKPYVAIVDSLKRSEMNKFDKL